VCKKLRGSWPALINRVIIEGSAQDGELLGILKGFEVVAAGVGGGRERRRLGRAQIFFQKV
jgi:hypothetical protein